jgi:hypothetical protein
MPNPQFSTETPRPIAGETICQESSNDLAMGFIQPACLDIKQNEA